MNSFTGGLFLKYWMGQGQLTQVKSNDPHLSRGTALPNAKAARH
jgi:hypothetical protein